MAVPASSVVQLRSPANPPSLQSCLLAAERASRDDAVRSLSWIVSAISSAAKGIAARLRTAGLDGALGAVGHLNVQGESQQALDVIANELLIRELESREGVMVLGSEENDELMLIDGLPAHGGRYAVLFDPLDGSSNLDVGGAVGTIFSIYQLAVGEETRLQAGRRQVAAGYQRSSRTAARLAMAAATRARWSPTCTACCCKVASSSTRRPPKRPTASCVCCTKPIRWR